MIVDILQLANEAQRKKEINPEVINATVGMYFNEEGCVGGMPSVFQGFKTLNENQVLPYPASDGGEPFKSNVISWVLGSYEDKLRKSLYIAASATPGGSGAIAGTFAIYANPGDYVFVSDIRWQYDRYAASKKLKLFEHNTFIDGHFDLDSFESRLEKLCKIQKQVIIVVNDPCHNPTGYTLSMDEWKEMLIIFNKFKENDIVFMYDLAYLEFTDEKDARLKISYLDVLAPHVLTIITFSGSKTFGIYGLRMGAAIALSKDETKIKNFRNAFIEEARGSWSATPKAAIELLNYFSDKKNQLAFFLDLENMKASVQLRSKMFKTQASEIGLETHPFKSGFYTIVLAKDPEEAFKKLLDHQIYTIPMAGGIRIALCSLPLKEIDGLAHRIQKIINE
ncbi:MAG: aminotransferase class I/II-fold pyridoxal phosphate-dependent enzyme [Acholeplasmataceae bacterium]